MSHGLNSLPLLPSGPGGVWECPVAWDLTPVSVPATPVLYLTALETALNKFSNSYGFVR